MNNILAVAYNTFQEARRDRLFYILLGIAGVTIAATLLAGSVSLDQDSKIIQDFGLASIFLFNVVMAIFLATSLWRQELEKRTIYLIFTRPVGRGEFVIGKFAGLAIILGLAMSMMAAVFLVMVSWKTKQFNWLWLEAIGLTYGEILMITAISLTLTSFISPLAGAVYTVMLVLIGHSMAMIGQVAQHSSYWLIKYGLGIIYLLLPNLEKFNIRNDVVYGVGLSPGQAAGTIAYTVLYICLLLMIAVLALRKREF